MIVIELIYTLEIVKCEDVVARYFPWNITNLFTAHVCRAGKSTNGCFSL